MPSWYAGRPCVTLQYAQPLFPLHHTYHHSRCNNDKTNSPIFQMESGMAFDNDPGPGFPHSDSYGYGGGGEGRNGGGGGSGGSSDGRQGRSQGRGATRGDQQTGVPFMPFPVSDSPQPGTLWARRDISAQQRHTTF